MVKTILFSILILMFLGIGCEKKLEPVPVGEMNEYKDPAYGFKIKYPVEWKQLGIAGQALFTKSQEVSNKFLDPRTGEEGAQVTAKVIKFDGKDIPTLIKTAKEEFSAEWHSIEIQPEQQIDLSGRQATKIAYKIPVTSKVSIQGHRIYIPGDTALYELDFRGFGGHYLTHNAVFDAMLASFELPVITAKTSDVWQPSSNLETYNTPFFSMQYPDNLNFISHPKGEKDFVMELRADRQDCSIHMDIFSAKGLTVEKVFEQNKGKYKGKQTGETSIDGNKTYWIDYSPRANINSRAYFTVKNDKVIRITINWFAPQKDVYFTTFEKCVNSLKLK